MREWSHIGLILAALPLTAACTQQSADDTEELYALALEDRNAFAERLTAGAGTDFERAHAVTTWFAGNFDWTATDYKRRTVEQTLERRGGNCNELALVTTAMLEELDDKAHGAFLGEVNLHEYEAEIDALADIYGQLRSDFVPTTESQVDS